MLVITGRSEQYLQFPLTQSAGILGVGQGPLIYLALNRQQAHERDVLATLFWPDEPEIVAKQNLRQSLYRLRQLLGETAQEEPLRRAQDRPYLLVTRTTVQFNAASDFTLDVVDPKRDGQIVWGTRRDGAGASGLSASGQDYL